MGISPPSLILDEGITLKVYYVNIQTKELWEAVRCVTEKYDQPADDLTEHAWIQLYNELNICVHVQWVGVYVI